MTGILPVLDSQLETECLCLFLLKQENLQVSKTIQESLPD